MSKTLVLSLKPTYAELIFAGRKTVEFRRVRPRLSKGDCIIVYTSSPVKAITGTLVTDDVVEDSLEYLWRKYKKESGLTKEQFMLYFHGKEKGIAIILREAKSIENPIELSKIRKILNKFHPPQCFMYLDEASAKRLTSFSKVR